LKTIRSLVEDGNICTPLFSTLNLIKDNKEILFNQEHMQRHPLGICAISESRFFNAYHDLLVFLDNQQDIVKFMKDNTLFVKTKEVIESFSAYIDDIYIIYKCFLLISLVAKEITFAYRWLEKAGCEESNEFKENIASFTMPFLHADNTIKHNHGRTGYLHATTPYKGGHAFGFYIEGVSEDGAIIPNEKIHPKFEGMATAYSFNRFLLEVFASFYFVSYYAEKSLDKMLKNRYSFILTSKKIILENPLINKIIEGIDNTLTRTLFEDEFQKCPQLDLSNGILIIKNPADKTFINNHFKQYPIMKIQMITSGDSTSRTFCLPYWKQKDIKK